MNVSPSRGPVHCRCCPKEAEGKQKCVNSLKTSSCFFSGIRRGHFSAASPACRSAPRRSPSRLSAPGAPCSVWAGGAGMARGTDKLNSVALQLIIMPRLSLTDTGDFEAEPHGHRYLVPQRLSVRRTCMAGLSLSRTGRGLRCLVYLQRCHQVYLRAISPFSAFTLFSTSSSSHTPGTAPLSSSYQKRGLKPSCAVFTLSVNAPRPPSQLAATWLTRRPTTGSLSTLCSPLPVRPAVVLWPTGAGEAHARLHRQEQLEDGARRHEGKVLGCFPPLKKVTPCSCLCVMYFFSSSSKFVYLCWGRQAVKALSYDSFKTLMIK